jgi:signal peptidase II
MAAVGMMVLLADQLTKLIVLRFLGLTEELIIVNGFFKLVHWTNRGAAWSLFHTFSGSNLWLGLFAILTLVVLFFSRHHFDIHTKGGQIALGLITGGVAGNLVDRLFRGHVIDFLYFYVERRGAPEVGFPAFNIADTAICSGVGLLFLLSWNRQEPAGVNPPERGNAAP